MTADRSKKPAATNTSSRRVVRRTVRLYCEGSGGPGAGWTLSAKWVPQRGGGYALWFKADSPNGYRNTRLKKTSASLDYQAICVDIREFPELRVGADLREDVEVLGLLDHEADKVMATCASDDDTPTPDWVFLDLQSEAVLAGLRKWLGPLHGEVAQNRIAAMQDLCRRLDLSANLETAGQAVGWEIGHPVHQLLGRLLRRWREVGHDAYWSKVAPDDPKVLTWVGDKVLAPRTAAEWMQVLETWIKQTVRKLPETTKYEMAEGLPLILEKLSDDGTTRVAIADLSPGLLERFRDTAFKALVSDHTPGQPPKYPGFQGSNVIRWQYREDIYRRLGAPPWFAAGSTAKR